MAGIAAMLCLVACGRAKEKINNAGEKVGAGTTEFFQGVAEGVDKTNQCKLEVGGAFATSGVKPGKFMVQRPDSSTSNHMLTVYLVFEQDYRGPVTLKVFDEQGQEYGRLTENIAGNKGEANFFDFIFDKRTDIEMRSKIVME
jgi:hypothetical protein